MRQRYRLYRRAGGRDYLHDDVTGKQESLRTNERATALRLPHSRNEAEERPFINLQIVKTYLAAANASIGNRTWAEVMTEFVKVKTGSNRIRAIFVRLLLRLYAVFRGYSTVLTGQSPLFTVE